MSRPTPVVLGSHISALGLIRSFAKEGLRCVCVNDTRGVAGFSRYADYWQSPDPATAPEQTVAFLKELGRSFIPRGVLFAAGDDRWLLLVSQKQKSLEDVFVYPMSDWSVIHKATDKAIMYRVAEQAGIPTPKTHFLDSAADLDTTVDVPLPAILKPSITVGFREALRTPGRTLLVKDRESLAYWKETLLRAGLGGQPLILQEKVKAKVEDLYTITLYANKSSRIQGYATGHKVRQYPPEAGTITAGRTAEQPQLYDLAGKLIKALGFHGICNIEFIRDGQDGSFRLIEINPRAGMWHNTVAATGINLPYLAYQDATGQRPTQDVIRGRAGIAWVHLRSDLFFSLLGYTLSGSPEHRLAPGAWRTSLRSNPVLAVESRSDPLPMVRDWATVPLMLAKIVFKQLVHVPSRPSPPRSQDLQSSDATDLESQCRSNREPTAA